MNLLPSGRWLALLAAAAPLFLLSPVVALGVDALLVALLLADALSVPGADQLRATRRTPARISLGARAEAEVRVDNRTARRVRVRLTDDLPPILQR
ncbi:MAG TPA: hypothetical protein VEQ60_02760, partial [Longimicrobium sp.]|nr:hypothetical protein [Longimicrobium sp.]